MIRSLIALTLLLACVGLNAYTLVGNGDDGSDLERLEPISSGNIIHSRDKAIQRLQTLGVFGIRHLGNLINEIKNSALYRVTTDKSANLTLDQGQYHSDMSGHVYARTIALPQSPTRFFPAANQLTDDQLIALHIHEGLHRTLPASVRENESIVSQITLALVSPEANRDQIESVIATAIPEPVIRETWVNLPIDAHSSSRIQRAESAESAEIVKPSTLGYGFRYFLKDSGSSQFAATHMHTVYSDLYPFGGSEYPFGLGLEGSLVHTERGYIPGPLGISARLKLWSSRNFLVGVWASGSFNTLSAEEMKNSPYGRDVFSFGTAMRKRFDSFYMENFLSLTLGGQSTEKIGLVDYQHNYGNVITAKIRGGYHLWNLDIGSFVEMSLADYYRVSGGSFSYDSGRYRILSFGPEISYNQDNFSVALQSRFLIDSNRDANFGYLGNFLETGISKGSIALNGSLYF